MPRILLLVILLVILSVILIVKNNFRVNINSNSTSGEKIDNIIKEKSGEELSGEFSYLPSNYNENEKYEEVELDSEEELVKHYKLSDSYFGDEIEEFNEYNLIKNNETINKEYSFKSNGTNFLIKIEDNLIFINELALKVHDMYNNEYVNARDFLLTINVGVIDLDLNDDYKEIIIKGQGDTGLDYYLWIYRIKKDGLELIFEKNSENYNSFAKIDDRYIFSNNFYTGDYKFIYGYYTYEDGVFKFINRFATGERVKSNNGEFNENFQKLIFTIKDDSIRIINKDYNSLKANTKFSFVSQDSDDYSIKIIEDTYWIDENNNELELIKAGTILDNLNIKFIW